MPPRPFALSLRIGVDIQKSARVKGILEKNVTRPTKGKGVVARLCTHVLTAREYDYFKNRFGDYQPGQRYHAQSTLEQMTTFLSGRWAAKEACVKAFKPRKLTLTEIEVWPDPVTKETYGIVLDSVPKKPGLPGSQDMLEEEPEYFTEEQATTTASDILTAEKSKIAPKKGSYTEIEAMALIPSHDEISGQIVKLSISHEEQYTVAVAMVSDPQLDP